MRKRRPHFFEDFGSSLPFVSAVSGSPIVPPSRGRPYFAQILSRWKNFFCDFYFAKILICYNLYNLAVIAPLKKVSQFLQKFLLCRPLLHLLLWQNASSFFFLEKQSVSPRSRYVNNYFFCLYSFFNIFAFMNLLQVNFQKLLSYAWYNPPQKYLQNNKHTSFILPSNQWWTWIRAYKRISLLFECL